MINKIKDDDFIETIEGENTSYSNDDLYNITSWGADFSFREIIERYNDGEIIKPELQRKYVWSKHEASRFIDSILLGLPVPAVFFAKQEDESMLIVDGYQRIMSVRDFIRGQFSGDDTNFKLSSQEDINDRWRGKTFLELDIMEQRRLKNTTIHTIIFEQKQPNDDTGMYQIFERINTGGRVLKPQEIRNCVYRGEFNKNLFVINKDETWRKIIGNPREDNRMADLELILRFFAIKDIGSRKESNMKQINLVKYLNDYMRDAKKIDSIDMKQYSEQFIKMINKAYELFGEEVFRKYNYKTKKFTKKLNPAIYDAISVALHNAIVKQKISDEINYKEKYKRIFNDADFRKATTNRTTNIDNIKKRISKASEFIFGIKYEW